MKKILTRLLRGSDSMIEKRAKSFVKTKHKEFDDMRTANIGFYDMPYKFAE